VMYVLNSSSLTYADHLFPQNLRDEAESVSTGSPIISYDDGQDPACIVHELPGTPPFAAATFRVGQKYVAKWTYGEEATEAFTILFVTYMSIIFLSTVVETIIKDR
jgi:hypothetical protein